MKINYNTKAWIIISTVVGIVLVLVILFFYNNFFRQSNASLIETVPLDAAFVFEVHDNEQFVKSTASVMPYLTDLFALDGLAGFESFIDRMTKKDGEMLVSGFVVDGKIVPVFSTRMDERYFNNLLKLLKIDPRNNVKFEDYEIYSYGTHYKDFKFVYHNNVFSASESTELLQKTIIQLKYPKGLTNQKSFRQLHKIVEKNLKQNWLLINPSIYADYCKSKTDEKWKTWLEVVMQRAEWCAYQVRFTDTEMLLSGYIYSDDNTVKKYAGVKQPNKQAFPQHSLPSTANDVVVVNADVKALADYFKKNALVVPPIAIEQITNIQPIQSIFFTLKNDSCTYHYCLLQMDPETSSFSAFFADSMNVDSLIGHNANTILELDTMYFSQVLSQTYKDDHYTVLLPVHGACLLSDSKEAVSFYNQSVRNNNFLETDNAFKFAEANMPSDAVCSFTFFNKDNVMKANLEEQFAGKSKLNDLKVISFSYSVPKGMFSGSSVYFKFN